MTASDAKRPWTDTTRSIRPKLAFAGHSMTSSSVFHARARHRHPLPCWLPRTRIRERRFARPPSWESRTLSFETPKVALDSSVWYPQNTDALTTSEKQFRSPPRPGLEARRAKVGRSSSEAQGKDPGGTTGDQGADQGGAEGQERDRARHQTGRTRGRARKQGHCQDQETV